MSTLLLIRHGQASFGTGDYDRLSAVGKEQSECLGAYWAARGLRFDALYCGPQVRHRETMEPVLIHAAGAGLAWPEPIILPGLAEFHWDAIMATALRAGSPPVLSVLAAAYRQATTEKERYRAFQALFEAATLCWVRGDLHDLPETWASFEARVLAAIDHICATAPRSARIAAFTSGGPIAVAVKRALGLSPQKALELVWTLRNGAINEFLFTPERYSLSVFNAIPHLDEPRLWTYR
jgi:broad specificity phosphatase PhoE